MTQLTGAPSLMLHAYECLSKSVQSITAGNIMLNQDFKEFIESLNDNQVRYLVVGGYAVALHGYPSYTKE